ncbi:MAG: SPOR domain-containing protein [Muribaculaceae bacterium]
MRKIVLFAAIATVAVAAFTSCKVSEKNYRKAYEQAVSGDSTRTQLINTVYGEQRRKVDAGYMVNGTDTLQTQTLSCHVAPDQAATPDSLHRYNVCVASFKQRFNANSLRGRLEQSGYPGAMVLHTTEPFYYVVALSTNDAGTAAATLQRFLTAPPFRLSQQPFMLIPRSYK